MRDETTIKISDTEGKGVSDIIRIVAENLGAYGFYCENYCECAVDDLFACGELNNDCVLGYLAECPVKPCPFGFDYCLTKARGDSCPYGVKEEER